MENHNGNNASILVVDDDSPSLESLSIFLRNVGFNVVMAGDGEVALEKVQHATPDIVLLDVFMQGVDGFETCAQLKGRPETKDVPVIFMTADSEPESIVKGFKRGAVDYIIKPFRFEEILARINTHLTMRKLQQNLQQKAQRLEVLRKIDQAILMAQSPEAIATAVLHSILQLVPCQYASVTLFDFDAEDMLVCTVGPDLGPQINENRRVPLQEFGGTAELRHGRPRIIKNLSKLTNPSPIEQMLMDNSFNALVNIPFIARGQLIGSLNLASAQFNIFSADCLDIAHELANQLTIAIMQNQLFEAEARRRQEAEALRDIATALNSSLNPNEVLEQILANAKRIVPHNAANIILIDDNDGGIIDSWGNATPEFEEISYAISTEIIKTPLLKKMVKAGQPLKVNNTQVDPDWQVQWQWVSSYIGVPIRINKRITGFLNLASNEPNFFTDNHTEQLKAFANQAAVAIKNARLHSQTETNATKLAALNSAGQVMTSTLDMDTVLELVMSEANAMINAEGTAVLLYNSDSNDLVFAAAASPGAEVMIGKHVPLNDSIAGWTFRLRSSVLIDDAQTDTRFYNNIDMVTGLTTRSILAVPLICKHEVVGVLEATNKAKGKFNQSDLDLLEALANSAAIAIENARLFEQVQAGRERLRRLAHGIVAAQEEERQRLSHELHDESSQILTALKIMLELIQLELPSEAENVRGRLTEATAMTDTTMERLRAIAQDLRPPALDTAGLSPTLEGLCREFAGWTRLSIEYLGTDANSLSDPIKISLYRFLQEALTNVAKHAQATKVSVTLDVTDQFINMRVQDDGQGFDKQSSIEDKERSKGLGLLGMQERLELLDGWLEIEAAPNQGMCLTAHIPLEDS